MSKTCEILAPVGNEEMLYAAIKAGAEAVYIGGDQFSARAYAHNFEDEKMSEAIGLCHFYNKKVYVTVNTIIKEKEMERAVNYIRFLYKHDVNAVILQDLGLARVIIKVLPDLDIHASTQLNTRNVYGAAFLKDIGFSRIVLAREIPIEEIKRIRKHVNIELELFIHGSLCVSESGNCYMSSFIGGRSGNRGRCAQPCRKEYQLYSKEKKRLGEENSFLSLKDLNTLESINDIADMGIDSLKIEGRMKRPEYVYSTIMNYRSKLEGFHYDYGLDEFRNRDFTAGFQWSEDNSRLKEIDRKDLHKGKRIGKVIKNKTILIQAQEDLNKGDILLFETNRGKHLQMEVKNSVKKKSLIDLSHIKDAKINSFVHRIANQSFMDLFASSTIEKKEVNLFFKGVKGEKASLTAECFGISAEVFSKNPVQEAENAPISIEKIKKQIAKTGNTLFRAKNIEVEIEKDIFMSMGELNALRRETLDALYEKITKKHHRNNAKPFEYKIQNKGSVLAKDISVETDSFLKLPKNIEEYRSSRTIYNPKKPYIFRVPRIDYKNETLVKEWILENLENINGFIVGSLNELYFVKGFEKRIYCDWTFNIVNSQHLLLLKEQGASRAALSLELNLEEINDIGDITGIQKEILIYGPLMVMSTRYCPFSILKKCDMLSDCSNCALNYAFMKDSKEQWLQVKREYGFSRIFNEERLETAEFFDEIAKCRSDCFRIDLSGESYPQEVFNHYYNLISQGVKGKYFHSEFSKAHYKRGVE